LQAVILSAGIGARLSTENTSLPKGLLEIGGRPLLEYSLEALIQNEIKDVILVVGFQHEKIKNRFGSRYHDVKIEYVFNEKYATSGSMYSFAMVQDVIEDEIILLESDILYEPRALNILLNAGYKNCILVTALSGSGDEVYICTNERQEITALGKKVPHKQIKKAIGELAGLSRFEGNFLDPVFKKSQKDILDGKFDYHYEECVFETSTSTEPVYAVFADDLVWFEIDTENDLKKAREQIYPEIKRLGVYKNG
jgi:2-aminoethylphosphonate-pyruvate transaminase